MPLKKATSAFEKARDAILDLKREADRIKKEEADIRRQQADLARAAAKKSKSEKPKTTVAIDLNPLSVAKATLVVLGVLLLGLFIREIAPVIVMFAIAGFLTIAFDPFVDWLQRHRVPRGLGILLIFFAAVALFAVVIYSFVPILATEIPNLAQSVLDWLNSNFGIDTTFLQKQLNELTSYLINLEDNVKSEAITTGVSALGMVSAGAFAVVKAIAGGIFNFFFVFVITFFMTIEEDGIKRFALSLFPARHHNYILTKSEAVEEKFGAWVRGQIILMIVVGFLTFLALKIAGVNYAATLGTFAGLMELIPYVGPFLAAIPAVIIAASQDGFFLVAVVVGIAIGVQQLEGNVIVPLVMKNAVGLSPVVIMFSMLVGASFPEIINPIVGIIISVPVATAISLFVSDYTQRQSLKEVKN